MGLRPMILLPWRIGLGSSPKAARMKLSGCKSSLVSVQVEHWGLLEVIQVSAK